MQSLLEWLKVVPTSFAGTVYEPWVELLRFILAVAIFVAAIAWFFERRSVKALMLRVWALLKEANNVLNHAIRYAPEAEHYRQRTAPYVMFTLSVVLGTLLALLNLCVLVLFALTLRPGITWYIPVIFAFSISILALWGRTVFVSASWEWHTIKTGEERPRRKSQVSIRREIIDKGPLSIISDDEPHSIAK